MYRFEIVRVTVDDAQIICPGVIIFLIAIQDVSELLEQDTDTEGDLPPKVPLTVHVRVYTSKLDEGI